MINQLIFFNLFDGQLVTVRELEALFEFFL